MWLAQADCGAGEVERHQPGQPGPATSEATLDAGSAPPFARPPQVLIGQVAQPADFGQREHRRLTGAALAPLPSGVSTANAA